MVAIKLHIHSDKKVVKTFLEELKEILNADDFNIERNMIIVKSSKDEIEYSTSYANRAFRSKTRRNKTMIKILFICHGITCRNL